MLQLLSVLQIDLVDETQIVRICDTLLDLTGTQMKLPRSALRLVVCTQVRTAVLQLLTALQIDLVDETRKGQLQKSGLGKVVMFLSKLPDETPGNRRLAKVRQLPGRFACLGY